MNRNRAIYIIFILTVAVVLFMNFNKKSGFDEEFSLPEGFTGCAYVLYNVEGAPELTLEEGTIKHRFNNQGISITSSPESFGWPDKDEGSGPIQLTYQYVDENGFITESIPIEEIHNQNLGSRDVDGEVIITKFSFSVKNNNNTCVNGNKLDELAEKYKAK